MKFSVIGTPAPQGSKRAFAIRKGGVPTGRVAVVEQQHERVKSWRQAVVEAVPRVASYPAGTPLRVIIVFFLRRPQAHYGTGRNAGTLKASAPPRPAKMPDLDKLVRATLDALTAAGCWGDDGQVCDLYAGKMYCDPGGVPGATIEIDPCGGKP